ncbi:hypothetical protein [Saccharothrix luteola]|uniref:hypothetical protein n=1 Tax=Saccharothrix luteola TaxID=2893018 RepID=UPI001E408AE8|nr:hypothetical protein [Saccharothrix luteola]MCC8249013.1 hypothetical protein [Saccharothrix luteola]
MTLLLQTTGVMVVIALHESGDRLRRLVVAYLTRTPSRARHRLLTPRQIRWRRWKSALADYVLERFAEVAVDAVPYPPIPERFHPETSLAPDWDAPDPPPRMAQSREPDLADDDRWDDEQTPATDYALPNGAAPGAAVVEPEVWPETWPEASPEPWAEAWREPSPEPRAEAWSEPSPEPWAQAWSQASAEPWAGAWTEPSQESWAEPWTAAWSRPWVEPRTEDADTYFTGHLDEPVHANPVTGRHAARETGFGRHALREPA